MPSSPIELKMVYQRVIDPMYVIGVVRRGREGGREGGGRGT
jgi:hypothetical protein